jgi:poly(A) polymerase
MRLRADWIAEPPVRAVLAALGGRAYFVGGCVRNALLGTEVTDIDFATPLRPEAVTERLEAAGLKAVPTGVEHGTVTAVAEGQGFEVTTFRADVETFGRHAVVRFTEDMAEDAARRDFTMNALYADAEGDVLDPIGGLPDLLARRVRFIGRAEDRIREDYLRILRFFRFSAWYAAGPLDPVGLAASAALADGIEALARERIGQEIRKLLAAPDPARAVAAMAETGVLARCLPGADAAALPALLALEAAAGGAPDWVRRLALVGGEAEAMAGALRLSKAETRRLATVRKLAEEGPAPAVAAEAAGAEAARSGLLVRLARAGASLPPGFEAEIARGAGARFPLAAGDLIEAGMAPGPAIGRGLAAARAAWIASDFTLDRQALLRHALEKGQEG